MQAVHRLCRCVTDAQKSTMKLHFTSGWIQNIILFALVGVFLGFVYLTRDLIASVASAERFVYAVAFIIVLFVLLFFLLRTINMRARAIADARTADLLETQKLFVELYRNSPVPYLMIDYKGNVTYPNHAALHLFGLVDDSFEGHNIFEMFEVADDEEGMHASFIETKFKQGVFVEGTDVIVKRADGGTRYGLLSIFPYGPFGSQKKGLMTVVDITKQKEIEQAKTEFVSLASHQLRTPISSMKWNLELMHSPQFGSLSEKQEEYFVKISNSAEKMNTLIDDFLNVSQLELGTKNVNLTTIEMEPFFESICEEFAGRVAQKNLTLEKRYDERLREIESDKSLLHMAVSNLVSNATKYTSEGGRVVVQYVTGNENLTISIVDSGVGIPKGDIEKLFTKFFRAANVREQVTEGTGLGLYIVKLAVEKIGGTISVQSEEGIGTAFDIVLPRSARGRIL